MTTTRALISAMQVTLDGYILGPEEDSDWVDSWSDALELLPPVDTFVLGGGMFPQYGQFWTTVLDDPGAATEMLGRELYPREISYAKFAAETPHLVVSSTLTEADTHWPTTSIVGLDDIRALKDQPAFVSCRSDASASRPNRDKRGSSASTSARDVRKLTMQARSAKRPSTTAFERNASPLRSTRVSRSWLSRCRYFSRSAAASGRSGGT